MTSPAVSARTSASALISRRRSPSVTTPARRPSPSTTHVMPRRLLDISWITSGIARRQRARSARRRRRASTFSTRIRRAPSLPPGCSDGEVLLAEALAHEQRHRQRVAQRERRGRAGGRHEVHRAGFLGDAAVERDVGGAGRASSRGSPVSAISRAPIRRIDSSSRSSSSVSPLCDSASTTSSSRIDAEVAVDRFGRVQEEGRTCRCSTASPRSCGR